MFEFYLVEFMKIVVNGIEDFCDVVVIPTKKYIEVALYIATGFLVFSIIAYLFELPTFVQYPESIACVIMLLIIYLSSAITMKDIKKIKSKIKIKTKKGTKHGKRR